MCKRGKGGGYAESRWTLNHWDFCQRLSPAQTCTLRPGYNVADRRLTNVSRREKCYRPSPAVNCTNSEQWVVVYVTSPSTTARQALLTITGSWFTITEKIMAALQWGNELVTTMTWPPDPEETFFFTGYIYSTQSASQYCLTSNHSCTHSLMWWQPEVGSNY